MHMINFKLLEYLFCMIFGEQIRHKQNKVKCILQLKKYRNGDYQIKVEKWITTYR
jgi:hypothetical protein